MEAVSCVMSNSGVNEPPPNPVAELESGSCIFATSCALSGKVALRPKSTVAEPTNDELTPAEGQF